MPAPGTDATRAHRPGVTGCHDAGMTETMTAYRIVEWGHRPELVEIPVPTPGPGEVLLEVAGNGLCHSDVGMSAMPAAIGEAIGWSVPFTLGHEIAGRVVDLGPGTTGIAVDTPVAVVSPRSCGRCRWCARGQDNNCDASVVGRGYGMDGGLARYVIVQSVRELVPLSALEPVLAGPLTDAGATSYHAVRRCLPRISAGGSAVVIGAGGLGAFAVQHLLALSPARVVVVDPAAGRRDYALELGAQHAIHGVDGSTIAQLSELLPTGADAVLDFVGTDLTVDVGLRSTSKGGVFALVGAGGGGVDGRLFDRLPRDGEIFTFQAPTIADTLDVLALADAGRLRVDVDLYPLARVAEAYDAMERGVLRGRAVVTPD